MRSWEKGKPEERSCARLSSRAAVWHQVSWCGGFAPGGVDVSATFKPLAVGAASRAVKNLLKHRTER